MKAAPVKLPLPDALRLMSAELWLRLGEPVQALLELQRLTKAAAKHPWRERVFQMARKAVTH